MNPVSLALDGVSVMRGGRPLFAPICASLAPGAFVALRGANGAGKTSLLRALAGLLPLAQGRIAFTRGAHPLDREDARQCCLLVSHEDALKPQRSPRQEARYWALALGGAIAHLDQALIALDLAQRADIPCRRLSAGQRRRAALLRLAVIDRPIWLLDEPSTNLDGAGRAALDALIEGQRARGGIVLAALHEASDARDGAVIRLEPV